MATSDAALTDREVRYTAATSRGLYRLRTSEAGAFVGGLEDVGSGSGTRFSVPLDAGEWSVDTTMVAWDDEPGGRDGHGKPGQNALSDFAVLIRPARTKDAFRSEIRPFAPPA